MNSLIEPPINLPPGFKVIRHKDSRLYPRSNSHENSSENISTKGTQPNEHAVRPRQIPSRRRSTASSGGWAGTMLDPGGQPWGYTPYYSRPPPASAPIVTSGTWGMPWGPPSPHSPGGGWAPNPNLTLQSQGYSPFPGYTQGLQNFTPYTPTHGPAPNTPFESMTGQPIVTGVRFSAGAEGADRVVGGQGGFPIRTHTVDAGPLQRHTIPLTVVDSSIPVYDANNLAKRPEYWRPDYFSRPGIKAYANGIFKRRSVYNKVTDPVKRALHPMLSYNQQRPPIQFNLRSPTFMPANVNLHPSLIGSDLNPPAVNPPFNHMKIYHPMLPWYIDLTAKSGPYITVFDAIYDIHQYMHTPIISQDFYNEELGHEERHFISMAFSERFNGDDEIKSQGVKRVDYLVDECILEGLVRGRHGLWELKTRRPDESRALNSITP